MIISFSQLGKHGRLGNQLFQIASTLGLAKKHQATAVFPEWEYADYFDVPDVKFEKPAWIPPMRVEESAFQHHVWGFGTHSDIRGYLQSEKYFGPVVPRLKEEFVEEVKRQFQVSSSMFQVETETICIHVRRGDFVGNRNYYQLPVTYYVDALVTHFPNWRECNLLFVSDDVEWCRVHFECLPNAYFSPQRSTNKHEEKEDVWDLAVMSLCDHWILSNSSFGWWGAWLGERSKSQVPGSMCKVVHPGHLFTGPLAAKNDARDYWPERWIRHQKDNYHLDLRDTTFMIPVRFDHLDRKGNLDLSLCLLQKSINARWFVCEQGGRKFNYMEQFAEYFATGEKKFHRTKMLNDMAWRAETKYVVNWDADVIIPPVQLWCAIEELRAGADVVYPYDGRFARMPRSPWFRQLQKTLDIGMVAKQPFKGREEDHFSVGGAVCFNKESFFAGGGENEQFISFGPEDVERWERFHRLGFDVRRVRGALFHMNHYVGKDSSRANPYFRRNHEELERIRGLEIGELREEVGRWKEQRVEDWRIRD